ncbi:hypothetical protein FVE85_3086 [Porphyridium purpureum]|uniref:Uncharacterized protein n=1 Tax=Porphyridium purpureum TaxID=35688 RepID=A0A5J4YUC2_PORPP|nr:hypothetical protein FVE85_3086 [Porphyridium purpureum]|eukprot:POR2527..scf227_4
MEAWSAQVVRSAQLEACDAADALKGSLSELLHTCSCACPDADGQATVAHEPVCAEAQRRAQSAVDDIMAGFAPRLRDNLSLWRSYTKSLGLDRIVDVDAGGSVPLEWTLDVEMPSVCQNSVFADEQTRSHLMEELVRTRVERERVQVELRMLEDSASALISAETRETEQPRAEWTQAPHVLERALKLESLARKIEAHHPAYTQATSYPSLCLPTMDATSVSHIEALLQ